LKVEKNVLTLKNNQNETSLAVVRCQQYRGSTWWTGSARIFSKSIGTKKPKWFTLMQRDYQNPKKEWVSQIGP
jgi:hypothetical protein